MNEYGTYLLVKSCLERCDELGINVKWVTDGWSVVYNKRMTYGKTANELLMYINGINDGLMPKSQKNDDRRRRKNA